ncbi:MAG: hypothetical protein ACI865_003076 [Flavobacteriaceae bacterium]|jgi:hypothetical protein
MKNIAVLICLTLSSISGNLFGQTDQEFRIALVTLVELDFKSEIENYLVPTIAIYQSGWVLYRGIHENNSSYYSVKLNMMSMQTLVSSLEINEELKSMADDFNATPLSGQPQSTLVLNFKEKTIKSVHGAIRNDTTVQKVVPPAFMHTFTKLIDYATTESTNWMPEKFEVIITERIELSESPTLWPTEWPSNFRENHFFGESILLPREDFETFSKLFASTKSGGIEFDGKVYDLAYRFPFPKID